MAEPKVCEFDVRVTPRSSQTKVESPDGVSLKIWVTAAPTDGQANEAVIEALSKKLKTPKSAISIVRGHTARDKRVRIEGISTNEALSKLGLG